MFLTGKQCQMSRVGLGLGVRDLAKLSGVSPTTIVKLEKGEELKQSTVRKIQTAIEEQGVKFINVDSLVGVAIPENNIAA